MVWENPWPRYRTDAVGLAIVEEMDSLAQAVAEDRPTRYDARRARADIEISMAAAESGRPGRGAVELPLTSVTEYEEQLHAKFASDHGCDPFDTERVVDVFFPEL